MNHAPIERVLMTCDTVGGVWTFALELAAALRACGTEVLLACLGGPLSSGQRAEARRLPDLQVAESKYKLEWMPDPWNDIAESGEWLLELAKRFRPDLVHLNSFGHGSLRWDSPVLLTAHSCVFSWWTSVHHEEPSAEWNRYRELVERAVASADVLVAPSRAMLASVGRHYRSTARHAKAIPNGRGAGPFDKKVKEPFVLAAGRLWDEGKNVTALDRVAPRLKWPCYVAGESRCFGAEVGFANCRMLARLSAAEMADWYGRASIYALPARYEPFGLSALEAALSGCALVLGDIESLREVWGDAALFVPPDDTGALEAALAALIDDQDLRNDMAARGEARGRVFTPEAMAATYLDAYGLAIGERSVTCAS